MGKRKNEAAAVNEADFAEQANPPGNAEQLASGAVDATDADLPRDGNGQVAIPKNSEGKAEKFLRLARQRMPKALKAIAVLGNLASKGQYSYTGDQVRHILKSLRGQVDALERRFFGTSETVTSWDFEK